MSALADLYRREPARINSLIAGLIVAGLLRLGVHVQDQDIVAAVALVVPIVLGELTRSKVSPAYS